MLRWARERANLSQECLAKRLNVKTETVAEWERTGKITNLQTEELLAQETNVPLYALSMRDIPKDDPPVKTQNYPITPAQNESRKNLPPMKTPFIVWFITGMLIFMIVAIYTAILINSQYRDTTDYNDPILERLGIDPRPELIVEEYRKANIDAIIDDIGVQMTFNIPALAQIDQKQITELIQNNLRFQYQKTQRIRGETYEVTTTAHINIHIDESATSVGEIAGIVPFLFIVDRNKRQVTEYYIQRADAYFGSNLAQPSAALENP